MLAKEGRSGVDWDMKTNMKKKKETKEAIKVWMLKSGKSLRVFQRMLTMKWSCHCCQNLVSRHADEETLAARDIMGRTLLHYAATLGRLGALSFDGICSCWIPPFRSTHSSRIEATCCMYQASFGYNYVAFRYQYRLDIFELFDHGPWYPISIDKHPSFATTHQFFFLNMF